MERFRGRGGVAKVERCIALHVAERILAGARVNAWHFTVDGQIKAVSKGSEAVRIRVHLVLQEVAQQRERGAVGTFRVRCNVDGRNDEATGEVAADAEYGVLDVFGGTNQPLEVATVFHVPITGLGNVVGADRLCVQDGLSNAGVRIKALEGVHVDVVHHRVVRVGEVHRAVGDLCLCGVTALDVQTKR